MTRNGRELFAKTYISLMDHPKVLARSELAFAAFIRALLYARVQHSGFISAVAAPVFVRGGDAAHRQVVLTELSTEQKGTGPMLEPVWAESYVGEEPELLGWQIHDWEEDNGLRTNPLSEADMSADSPADNDADMSADNADESPADRRRRLDRDRKRRKRKAQKEGVKPTAPKATNGASEGDEEADKPADTGADMSADSPADSRADGEKTKEDKTRKEKGRGKASARTRTRPPTPSRDKDGVISGVAALRVVQAFEAQWQKHRGKPLGLSERHNAHYTRAADVVEVAEKMRDDDETWEAWVARALVAAVPKLVGRNRPWWDFCETPAFWLEHAGSRTRSASGGMFPASSSDEHKRDAAEQELPGWMTGAAE